MTVTTGTLVQIPTPFSWRGKVLTILLETAKVALLAVLGALLVMWVTA
jgi:hypothetical protein